MLQFRILQISLYSAFSHTHQFVPNLFYCEKEGLHFLTYAVIPMVIFHESTLRFLRPPFLEDGGKDLIVIGKYRALVKLRGVFLQRAQFITFILHHSQRHIQL